MRILTQNNKFSINTGDLFAIHIYQDNNINAFLRNGNYITLETYTTAKRIKEVLNEIIISMKMCANVSKNFWLFTAKYAMPKE